MYAVVAAVETIYILYKYIFILTIVVAATSMMMFAMVVVLLVVVVVILSRKRNGDGSAAKIQHIFQLKIYKIVVNKCPLNLVFLSSSSSASFCSLLFSLSLSRVGERFFKEIYR